MPHLLSSFLDHNWERKILVLLIIILGGLFFTWKVILEAPPTPVPRQVMLPTPPHLFQWENDTPEFLMPNNGRGTDNPFVTAFPLEKPPVAVEQPVQTPQVMTPPEPEEVLPTTHPKRTVVISFNGLRTAITGAVFAILEVSDSDKGVAVVYLKQGDGMDCGFHLTEISEKAIRLANEKGEDLGTISYGKTQIFTIEHEE